MERDAGSAWPVHSITWAWRWNRLEEVQAATRRLSAEGLEPDVQESTTCCYALQDKAWVNDPDGAPWEIYTVLADAPQETDLGCSTEGCAA